MAHPLFQFFFKEESVVVCGLEFVQPCGLFIPFCEEYAVDPVGVSALDHAECKDFLSVEGCGSEYFHFAGCGGHRGSAYGSAQSAHALIGVSEDFPGLDEGECEEVVCAGVAGNEHVVGDHALAYLFAPHGSPYVGAVVDVSEYG